MSDPDPPWKCFRCLMTFKIRAAGRAETLQCPLCKLPFWTGTADGNNRASVGMETRPIP